MCKDSTVPGAVSSVTDVSGSRVNGITRVSCSRKLDTGTDVAYFSESTVLFHICSLLSSISDPLRSTIDSTIVSSDFRQSSPIQSPNQGKHMENSPHQNTEISLKREIFLPILCPRANPASPSLKPV